MKKGRGERIVDIGRANYYEWEYEGEEYTNLDRRANSNANSQIHLILTRHRNSGNMLRRIPDNGQDNESDKGLAQRCIRFLNNRIDRADHKLRTSCYQTS